MSVRLGEGFRVLGSIGAVALVTSLGSVAHADDLEQAVDVVSPDRAAKAKSASDAEEDGAEEMSLDDVKVSGEGERVAQGGTVAGNRARQEARRERAEADKAEEERKAKGLPARLPWRGSAFSWGHSVSPTLLGIGDDVQGDEFAAYNQNFSIGLNYFFIDQKMWSLAVATSPSMTVEVTNSNITTTEREPHFNDLPFSLAYRRRLHSDPEAGVATGLVLNGTVVTPTSPVSQAEGTYLRTSPRVVLWQVLPLLGKDSPFLRSIILGGSFRWDHRFGEATTPVGGRGDNFGRSVQGLSNQVFLSDQYGFGRLTQNTLREGLFLFFSETYGNQMVQAFGSFSFTQNYQPAFPTDTCVNIATGECVTPTPLGEATGQGAVDSQFGYGFAVGASYFPMPEFGLSLAYANAGNQLGPDGQRQSIAYNPRGSQFSASIAIGFDAIYEAITGPRRAGAFFLVAENEKKNRKKTDKRRDEESSPIKAAETF